MPRRVLPASADSEEADSSQPTPNKRRRTTKNGTNDSAVACLSGNNTPATQPQNPEPAIPRGLAIEYHDLQSVGGTIKSVRLKNFMCHANVKVDFHKSVTFIHGRNGSGKSAILAGLVLGLGGKPSALNRGNTVKEYIRTQYASAEVSIVFNNVGAEAYKPEVFGKEITIERIMMASGRSTYRVKNERGAIVSSRFDDIGPILRCYNFQLDNPVMILTQDTSRTFLAQAKPNKLYEMFYRGTQLQKMDEDFQVVLRNQEILTEAVKRRQNIINELEEELASLQTQIQSHAKAQENRDRLAYLAKEFAWAKYRDANKELTDLERQVATLEQRAADLTNAVDTSKEVEAGTDEKLASETRRLDEIRKSLEDLRKQCAKLQRQVDDAQRLARDKQLNCKKFEREIESHTREKNESEACIRKIQDKQMNDEKKQLRDRKEVELHEVQERRQRNTAAIENFQKEVSNWDRSLQALKTQSNSLRDDMLAATRKYDAARRHLNEVQMAQSNSVARFGREIPHLMQLIDEAVARGQFHRRPRGPIGAYVTLRDDRYATAVEACLGRALLCGFACHDFEDNRKLEELMFRCGYNKSTRPQIYIRNFGDEGRTYDVSRSETKSEQYPNILSVLDFNDLVVRNLLIDQRRIETVILFENEQEMREVMRYQPPAKATSAYDIQGGNALLHPTFRFYPPQFYGGARYLVKSLDAQLHSLQEQIQQHEEEKNRLENSTKELKRQIASEEEQKSRSQRGIAEYQKKIGADESYIRHLEQAINDLVPANTDTHMFEEDIRETDRKIAEATEALAKAEEEYDEQLSVVRGLQEQVDEKRSEEEPLTDQLQEQQQLVDRLTGETTRKRRDVEKNQRLLEQTKTETKTVMENVTRQKEKADNVLEQAKELHEEPIDTEKECTAIEREIHRLHNRVTIFEQSAENLQGLVEKSKMKMVRMEKVQGYLLEIEETTAMLDEAIRARKNGYREIKVLTGAIVKQRFIRNLSGRNYSGKLEIDEEKHTLIIFVEPRESDASNRQLSQPQGNRGRPQTAQRASRAQDLRGLSGGERSYSTVSFIMALWETMNAPCCCMDEFDVFMDHCSRRMIMELLISFAWKTRPNNQFVFLTPLSVSELPFHEKGLKVFDLKLQRDGGATTSNNASTSNKD